jgi:hypothetical protein
MPIPAAGARCGPPGALVTVRVAAERPIAAAVPIPAGAAVLTAMAIPAAVAVVTAVAVPAAVAVLTAVAIPAAVAVLTAAAGTLARPGWPAVVPASIARTFRLPPVRRRAMLAARRWPCRAAMVGGTALAPALR